MWMDDLLVLALRRADGRITVIVLNEQKKKSRYAERKYAPRHAARTPGAHALTLGADNEFRPRRGPPSASS